MRRPGPADPVPKSPCRGDSQTRFFQLTIFNETPKAVDLAELELFSGGFVNQASYLSEVIQLDDVASWGNIGWSGRHGINDRLKISYTLLRVTAPVPVSIGIYDLVGELVREVYSGDDPIGAHVRSWDGRDRSNRLVPPGICLYRIRADLQAEPEIASGTVAVAY